jgi:hypothetical protein
LQGLSGDSRDLELHWALGLVLHDDDCKWVRQSTYAFAA